MNIVAKKAKQADAACLFVAFIWGSGFIASQYAIDAHMSASLIMALRFGIAAMVMLLLCARKRKTIRRSDMSRGILAGVLLFCAFYLQIYGQARTTVSNCAFLTATNVVMVPFIVWIATKKPPPLKTFLLAVTTLAGIGLLTLGGDMPFGFGAGDGIILLCALLFALHIFYLGHTVQGRDAMVINLLQISTAAVISGVVLLFDRASVVGAHFAVGLAPAIYLGLFSTCVCYLLQTWAQKYTSSTKAGILLSTEGLFGSLFSVVLGFEQASAPMVTGGLVIFASVVLMEVPAGIRRRGRGYSDGTRIS